MKDLFEKLAAIEHERWSDWQKYVCSQCMTDCEGNYVIDRELFKQWDRQSQTAYADLSEKEKESDRDQVRRYWHLITTETMKKCNDT